MRMRTHSAIFFVFFFHSFNFTIDTHRQQTFDTTQVVMLNFLCFVFFDTVVGFAFIYLVTLYSHFIKLIIKTKIQINKKTKIN